MENKGLIEKVDELFEEKENKKKKKGFKLSFGLRSGSKSKIRKNQVLAFIIRVNGNMDIKWLKISNNMVYLKENDTYHDINSEDIKYYKKYPYIILPEWILKPINPLMIHKDIDTKASDQRFIIRASKLSLLKTSNSISGKAIFWFIIIGSAVAYMLYNQGLT